MDRRALFPLLALPALAQYEESKGEVPWVPSPNEVIDTLFRMAKVTAQDTVYDLGSGDGRVVIYAAKHFGARGVGIEIEGHRVAEARTAAIAAGVVNRVRFIEQDAAQASIAGASVVFLYMYTSFMAKLKPKLLAELRPGTRVVAYQFNGMGDWKPRRVNNRHAHPGYLWIVPTRPA
ncbi:MAG TPA: class I SAM-dependent methyltransferase [Bryobacteraceae bacterium]|nr:class I SAM-dependent methyltransferase [Bryobacteraceae bacterium]